MAYSSNPGPDEDLFDDGPKKDMSEHDGMDQEGVLPKSLMAGKSFKPGDEIVLEVTRVGEHDFSVRYATEKKEGSKEEEAGETPAEEMAERGGEMDEMY